MRTAIVLGILAAAVCVPHVVRADAKADGGKAPTHAIGGSTKGEAGVKAPASSAKAERAVLIKLTARSGEESYEVMSNEQYRSAQEELSLENRYETRAMMAAQKDWRETEKKPFPRLAKKSLDIVGSFSSRELAEAKLKDIEERAAREEERKEERAKDRDAWARRYYGNNNRYGGVYSLRDRTGRHGSSGGSDEGDKEREALKQKAVSLFEQKLAEIVTGEKAKAEQKPAAGAPAAGAPGADAPAGARPGAVAAR